MRCIYFCELDIGTIFCCGAQPGRTRDFKVHLDHVEPLDVESFKRCALLRGVCPAQDPLQTLPSARHVASRGALPVFVPFSRRLPGTAAE